MWQLLLCRLLGKERMAARWQVVHRHNAKRLYRGFVSLRGVFIKLGQILSLMGNFLPKAYSEELEGLQDEVPPQPYKHITKSFVSSFGKKPEEIFREFSETPIAAASLGQVHKATTHNGESVAVKILYPNIQTIIAIDLRVLGWALKVYKRFVPVRQIERVHEQLRDMLRRETNYIHEASCIAKMRDNFKTDRDVVFPQVFSELSSDRVLTMSFLEGVKIGKLSELEKVGLDRTQVGVKLIQSFYKQLFIDRFFHADPHPGNFFVQKNEKGLPRLVILDLGSACEITDTLADGMFDIIKGLMTKNDDLVIKGVETMGFVAENGDRQLLERVTRKYFEKLLNLNITDLSKLSLDVAAKLGDSGLKRDELRRLMASVEYPNGWFYVERAIVIMFGLCAQLAPTMNTLQVGFPYIMAFLNESQRRRDSLAPPAKASAAGAPPVARA